MWKPSPSTGTLIVLSGLLALGSVACSGDDSVNLASESPATASTSPSPSPSPSTAAAPSQKSAALMVKKSSKKSDTPPEQESPAASEAYDRAIDLAAGATTISKSAASREDWNLVASQWQEAINLLKTVPSSSKQHGTAKTKLNQYQRFLADAKVRATPPPKKTQPGDLNPQFFSVPIKGQINGTPIIEVSFNGSRKFDMLFDTGANVTLITREIAQSLQLKPQGITQIAVADGAVVAVFQTSLKSMEIDGRLKRNMSVVVAPPAMPIGLLGQDFFEGYDITIKQDVIEFRKR